MPVFLDQSLRKALLAAISQGFSNDPELAGKVRAHDQEIFLPEADNQIILTDISVQNESLDAANKVTELRGRVTFAPVGQSRNTFMFWAQENPRKQQPINSGFYELLLEKKPLADGVDSTPTSPDETWLLSADVINRETVSIPTLIGLKIGLDNVFPVATFNPASITVKQNLQFITPGADYTVINTTLYLRKYDPQTWIYFDGHDITNQCTYVDTEYVDITFTGIDRPVELPTNVIPSSVSVTDLLYKTQVTKGWALTKQNSLLVWTMRTARGAKVRISYQVSKPMSEWTLPTELNVQLKDVPLVYKDGSSSLTVASSLRGKLSPPLISMTSDSPPVLQIIEPVTGESITVDYRYFTETLGPEVVYPASNNDTLIPGLSLTFTDNFSDQDRAVIVLHDSPKPVGTENGGTNKIELSLKLRSSDDKVLDQMTTRVFFTFTDQANLFELSSQGIMIENNVSYVRSTEERDTTQAKWFINTFRLTVHHTWRYLLPYITDLNTINTRIGSLESPNELACLTFSDIINAIPKPSWVQDY